MSNYQTLSTIVNGVQRPVFAPTIVPSNEEKFSQIIKKRYRCLTGESITDCYETKPIAVSVELIPDNEPNQLGTFKFFNSRYQY